MIFGRGPWTGTWTGRRFHVLDPRAEDVTYDDVVIANARECRYGNMCREHYSVLTHELLVSVLVEKLALERGWPLHLAIDAAREGLVHDGGEAYTKDMPAPLKNNWRMWGYRRITTRVQREVFRHFGVYPTKLTSTLVHEVDVRLRVDEIEQLMIDPALYGDRHGDVDGFNIEIPAFTERQSIDAFCHRFQELFPEYLLPEAA